ncbi:ATP-binding protein [Mumia zhuanghuii]|uniref:Orc1-like AAA ATPase domain-containing protein n=1 Tax=Mumia zhuanghuii TaxID=2585211 RepID=A0A5C4MWS9_9ACTN|nr:ATP-binding protein [Mumia zhuanghuii]TNC32998.1 hypothetical protein FHE65_29785 [Mumia zhuanghuii]TNC48836.1 hypothetical protein FHE65_06615 [Mumia zhuanghuii]
MGGTAGVLFDRARRRALVGRDGELAQLRAFLEDYGRVLAYLHGPGGVGKSALLEAVVTDAVAAGKRVVTLDCAELDPGSVGFRERLRATCGVVDDAVSHPEPVLALDRFELVEASAGWFWRSFVPALPERSHVLVAGRRPPPASWRTDPAFTAYGLVVPVRNLDPEPAAALVRARGVTDETTVAQVVRGSRGHPLAIVVATDALAAGTVEGGRSSLLSDPDVTATLLGRFLDEGVTPLQRAALHVCGHARRVDRAMLREVLGLGDTEADALLEWIRERPYAESRTEGLTLHDVVRDALDRDLRWRDREAFADLHRRIRRVVVDRMSTASERAQERLAADLLHLHRGNPAAQDLYAFEDLGTLLARPLEPDDVDWVVDAFENEARADAAAYWLQRQPEAWTVFEDVSGRRSGACLTARVDGLDPAAAAADPVTCWGLAALARRRPPEPGEVVLHQIGLDASSPGRIGPVSDQVAAQALRRWRVRDLGWVLVSSTEEDAWAPVWTYIGFERLGACRVHGREVGVWARDFARSPYEEWLEGLGDRELDDTGGGPPPVVAPIALARVDFRDAVRTALKDLADPVRLRRSPLAGSRLVAPGDDVAVSLASRVRRAVAVLAGSPRSAAAARALDRTYLRPSGSQEKAAEVLGLPFSTYRRHLAAGVDRVEEVLWDWELHGVPDGQGSDSKWSGD